MGGDTLFMLMDLDIYFIANLSNTFSILLVNHFSSNDNMSSTLSEEADLAVAPLPDALDHWKDKNWLKDHFPFQKGKGKQQPPQEHLCALTSDSERAHEVLRWRGLTSEEQWIEREALGQKKSPSRRKVRTQNHQESINKNVVTLEVGLAALNIREGIDRELQEANQPFQDERNTGIQVAAPGPVIIYHGYLDNEESRSRYATELCSAKKKAVGECRTIGSCPKTKAQVKDKISSTVRASVIQRLFTYIKMTTPPEVDAKGKSTADWPKLMVALVIVDGFKPNLPNGGRRRDGTERRDKKMVAFMGRSVDDCSEVLHFIKEGIIHNNQGSFHPIYESCCFAYNYEDAIAAVDQKHIPTLQIGTGMQQQNSEVRCEISNGVDWTSQMSIKQNFPLWKDKGSRPVPLDFLLETYHSDDARKKFVYQWRRYTLKAQLEFEQSIACKTNARTKVNRRGQILTTDNFINMAVLSPVESPCLSETCKKASKRIVGSQPLSKAGIKDAVTTRVLRELIKRIFLYISMTTPLASDMEELQAGDWPQLKVGLIIFDELLPNRSLGGAPRRDGEERREKKRVAFITGSENDRDEILEAIDDGILSRNENKRSRYDPVFATNVKDANATDFHGFESVRNRPPARVLSIDEITPTVKHRWNLTIFTGNI